MREQPRAPVDCRAKIGNGGERLIVSDQRFFGLRHPVFVDLAEMKRGSRFGFGVLQTGELELDELHQILPLTAFRKFALERVQGGLVERIGIDRASVEGDRFFVASNALFGELAHLVQQGGDRRALGRDIELALVSLEQIFPASGAVVHSAETGQRRQIVLVDFDDFSVTR